MRSVLPSSSAVAAMFEELRDGEFRLAHAAAERFEICLDLGVLGGGRLGALLVGGDVRLALLDELGELDEAGLHRLALVVQGSVPLALGGDLDLQFVEFTGEFRFLSAEHFELVLRLGAAGLLGLELARAFGEFRLQAGDAARGLGVAGLDARAFAVEPLLLALGLLRFALD
jgi:hypothetical protein